MPVMITEQEILERLENLKSGRQLALKGALNWATAADTLKAVSAKDAMALANSGGGWLVFGARDGELAGLSDEDYEAFDADAVSDFVNAYAQPEVECSLIKTSVSHSGALKRLAIIAVAEFSDVPVICTADAESPDRRLKLLKNGSIYVRNEDGESVSADNFSAIGGVIDRAVDKRVARLSAEKEALKISQIEVNEAAGYFRSAAARAFDRCGYWEFVAMPELYHRERVSPAEINRFLEDAKSSKDGFYMLHPQSYEMFADGGQYLCSSPKTLECARIYSSGVFVWRGALPEDYGVSEVAGKGGERVLSLENAVDTITRFFMFLAAFYGPRARLDCGLRLEATLHGAAGRRLSTISPFHTVDANAVAKSDSASVFRELSPDELKLVKKNSSSAAADLAALFNWRNYAEAQKAVVRIVEAASARLTKAQQAD